MTEDSKVMRIPSEAMIGASEKDLRAKAQYQVVAVFTESTAK